MIRPRTLDATAEFVETNFGTAVLALNSPKIDIFFDADTPCHSRHPIMPGAHGQRAYPAVECSLDLG
jgi:hypothetical protein